MILKLPLTLARFSGLLINFERRSRWFYLITILTILNTANFVMGIAHFMLKHLDNFDYFTNSFGAFSNMLVNILKTCMFLSTNEKLRIMMRKLEGLALDDRRSNYAFSSEADRLTDSYTKKFLVIVYISVFGITFAPLMAVAWEYFTTGQVVDTNWALPFKSEFFFFDVKESPYFEFVYVVYAIGIPACANCIVGIDTIFMGLCLHTVALFKDLKASIQQVDKESSLDEKFRRKMLSLINYHNQILELMAEIESTFNRLFFTQFLGTIFILCSQSYLATMNRGRIEIVSNITFYCASATQFLIYTNFGDLLASESNSVGPFVAALKWYERRPGLRIYYQMMIHRAQKGRGLSFMHWIYCDRRLMLNLIVTSYNVFAVLQNVKGKH